MELPTFIPDNQAQTYFSTPTTQPSQATTQPAQSSAPSFIPDAQAGQYFGQQTQPQQPSQPSIGGFLGNAVNSVGSLIGGAASAIGNSFNPNPDQNTIVNLGRGIAGAGENALNATVGTQFNDQNTKIANNIGGFYDQRYGISDLAQGNVQGTLTKIANTIYSDPAGALADLSVLLDAGGGAVKALGALGEAGAAADAVRAGDVIAMGGHTAEGAAVATPTLGLTSEIGKGLSKAGEMVNPMNIVTAPVKMLGKAFGGLQSNLEEINTRLTPLQKQKFGESLQPAMDFIAKDISVGGPQARYATVADVVDETENAYQSALKTPGIGAVSKSSVIKDLQAIPSDYMNDTALYPTIQRQINEIVKTVQETQGTEIPADVLNQMKRSFWKGAFDSQGLTLRNEVKLAAGDVFKNHVESVAERAGVTVKVPESLRKLSVFKGASDLTVRDYNRAYGTILNGKKVLKLAIGKNQVGLTGRFISGMVGGAVGTVLGGGPVGGYLGVAAGESLAPRVAGTAGRAALGKVAGKAGNILVKMPAVERELNAASRAGAANASPGQRAPSPGPGQTI